MSYRFRGQKVILNGNEQWIVPSALPSSPSQGYFCLDQADNKFKFYHEGRWVIIGSSRIQKDDSDVNQNAQIINYEGNVTVTDEGSNKITIGIGKGDSAIGGIYALTFGEADSANNEWIESVGDGKNSDDSPQVIPWDSDLVRITFTNSDNNSDSGIEIWKSDKDNGNNSSKVHEWDIRDCRTGAEVLSTPVSFNFGDKVAVYLDDEGINPDDVVVMLWFKIRTDNGATFCEEWSGNIDGHGSGGYHD